MIIPIIPTNPSNLASFFFSFFFFFIILSVFFLTYTVVGSAGYFFVFEAFPILCLKHFLALPSHISFLFALQCISFLYTHYLTPVLSSVFCISFVSMVLSLDLIQQQPAALGLVFIFLFV